MNNRFSWYINRLRKMPFPEIPWRASENVKKKIDKNRRFTSTGVSFSPKKTIFSLSKYAASDRLKELFPESIKHHINVADSVFDNRFKAFNINISYKNYIDWHLDPVTNGRWPESFWGDIDYRNNRLGDVKFVWEINRLYFLFSLGLSYRVTKNKKYADKIVLVIKSWIKNNPYPFGVNWASGIEAGVRLTGLVWALSFMEKYSFSKEDLQAINSFVQFNAIRLHRYPSKYSSSNNHLLAEGFGLFLAGLYFPYLAESKKWYKKGKDILENEVTRQILPDGGSFEYSTTYLSFVFDFFLFFKWCCDTNDIEYNKDIDKRLKKSCEFINSIMDKNGNIPNIGDQDSAVLINYGLNNLENFQSIINTGAILFQRDDFASDKPDLKTFLLTGKTVIPRRDTDKKNKLSSILHKNSGLSVIKDLVEEKEIHFVGNAMPLGMGPLYAHGHLDALSFTLSVDGEKIFVDPGTYLYHGKGKWREYFRSTAAHNTVRLNRNELSKQIGGFMYGRPYRIINHSLKEGNGKVVWKSEHDAYLKKLPYAKISREVIWDRNDRSFQITDTIRSKQKGFVELFFHFHPQCVVKIKDKDREVIIQKKAINIKLLPDSSLDMIKLSGSLEPMAGWYSPHFNEILETTSLRLSGIVYGEQKIITKLSICLN